MSENNVTSIVAGGFVVADYDTAQFSLNFSEYAPKAKAAKAKLKEGVDQINKVLASLKDKGLVMLSGTYLTGPTVGTHTTYDRVKQVHVVEGQKATYNVSFQTQTLEMVNEVYDTLTELDLNELSVSSPSYSVKAESDLKQKALEDAWRVAQVLFANQCGVLELDKNNFSIASWQVNYSNDEYGTYNGKFRNSTATPMSLGANYDDDDAIAINAGKAKVKVTLTVDYARKAL